MKFLVIGLGSMGKRRTRTLYAHGENDIIGFDLSSERRAAAEKEYGISTTADIESLPDDSFDAVIISTPPNAHGEYIKFALKRRKHFFSEVGTSDDGYAEIESASDAARIMAPSCTLRFSPPIKRLKKCVEEGRIGKVLAWNYHVGQYLPLWHPFEDYRKVFFSKKETGACRELFPFELSWLSWVVGSEPIGVTGFLSKVSDLAMDAEDVLCAAVRHKNGVCGNLLIDAVSRKLMRNLTLLGTEGTLEWRLEEQKIVLYSVAAETTEEILIPKETSENAVQSEAMYIEEIGAFLDALRGHAPYPYTFKEERVYVAMLTQLIKA